MKKEKPFYTCFELSGNVSRRTYYNRSENLFSNSSMNYAGHVKNWRKTPFKNSTCSLASQLSPNYKSVKS